jgi:hypothetical protein
LMQTFVRFPSWDERWIKQSGYSALNVGGVVRAFSSFASASEYAMFLVVGLVCWLALGLASRWRLLVAPAVVLLAEAIWYESARGAVVLLVASLFMMLAARLKLRMGWALVLGALAIAAIPTAVESVAPAEFSSDPGSALAQHQVSGLSNPFGEGSTLPGHIQFATDGIAGVLHEPLGFGVGSTTIAAEKLGSSSTRGVEVDAGNAAVAAGLVGFGAYVCVLTLGIRRAYNRARSRDALTLAALGVLFATLFQWLSGGQYAVAILPWLVFGWLDRPERGLWTRPVRSNTAPEGVRVSHG